MKHTSLDKCQVSFYSFFFFFNLAKVKKEEGKERVLMSSSMSSMSSSTATSVVVIPQQLQVVFVIDATASMKDDWQELRENYVLPLI